MSVAKPLGDWVEKPQRRSCTQPRQIVTGSRTSVEIATAITAKSGAASHHGPIRHSASVDSAASVARPSERSNAKRDVDRAVVPPRPLDLV